MLIAHASDLHYSSKNLAEADACFGAAIDRAIEAGATVLVVSGDSTDHGLEMHSEAAVALMRQIRRFADRGPVLMLQGTFSHEPPGTLDVMPLLGGQFPVITVDDICQVALDSRGNWHRSESWCFTELPVPDTVALFSCLPTVNKGALAAALGAADAAGALGEHVSAVLGGFAPSNEEARAADVPTIVVSHGTVHGCRTEHDVPMAGLDHEFTLGSLLGAQANVCMIGHIHKHQVWEEQGRYVGYPGSIGRFHHGEKGPKGFILWDVTGDKVRYSFEHTPARRTIDIRCNGVPNLQEIEQVASSGRLDGVHVRLIWDMPADAAATVDQGALARAMSGAASVQMDGRITSLASARSPGISKVASMMDQVRAWAELAEQDPDALAANVELLQHKDVAGIVAMALEAAGLEHDANQGGGTRVIGTTSASRHRDRTEGTCVVESISLF